jgi:hypothetical protein
MHTVRPRQVFDAACWWLRENAAVYEPWLPPPIVSCDKTQACGGAMRHAA